MGGYGNGGGNCGGSGDEDRGGVGPELGGYRDVVGGGINWGGEGGQGKGGGRDHGVGDADEGGTAVCGNEGAVTRPLPAEEGFVSMGTTPAWACCCA